MEEFTNKDGAGAGRDEIRLTEKRVTLQPLHDDIRADDAPDAQVAASHINGTAIANIASDRETTAADPQVTTLSPQVAAEQRAIEALEAHKAAQPPSKAKRHGRYASIIGLLIIIAIALFALLYR